MSLATEYSPHDFRLAPLVTVDGGTNMILNPLVNRGIGLLGTADDFPIRITTDEMGTLIIGGFFDGTRILSPDPVPNAPLATPHGGIYFFDLAGPWPRPVCNIFAAGFPNWFQHVQGSIDSEIGDYTQGTAIGSTSPPTPATRTWLTVFGWKPFMRGLECDFPPHLVPDLHPYWGGLMVSFRQGCLTRPVSPPSFVATLPSCMATAAAACSWRTSSRCC